MNYVNVYLIMMLRVLILLLCCCFCLAEENTRLIQPSRERRSLIKLDDYDSADLLKISKLCQQINTLSRSIQDTDENNVKVQNDIHYCNKMQPVILQFEREIQQFPNINLNSWNAINNMDNGRINTLDDTPSITTADDTTAITNTEPSRYSNIDNKNTGISVPLSTPESNAEDRTIANEDQATTGNNGGLPLPPNAAIYIYDGDNATVTDIDIYESTTNSNRTDRGLKGNKNKGKQTTRRPIQTKPTPKRTPKVPATTARTRKTETTSTVIKKTTSNNVNSKPRNGSRPLTTNNATNLISVEKLKNNTSAWGDGPEHHKLWFAAAGGCAVIVILLCLACLIYKMKKRYHNRQTNGKDLKCHFSATGNQTIIYSEPFGPVIAKGGSNGAYPECRPKTNSEVHYAVLSMHPSGNVPNKSSEESPYAEVFTDENGRAVVRS